MITIIAVGAVVAFIIFWPDLLLRMVGESGRHAVIIVIAFLLFHK